MGVERRGGHLVSGSFGQESSSQIVALVNMATRIFLDEKVALGTGFTSGWDPGSVQERRLTLELTAFKADCWVQKLLFCSPILLCN